jgi:hypothetical protein
MGLGAQEFSQFAERFTERFGVNPRELACQIQVDLLHDEPKCVPLTP